jgi:chorismate mutase
MSDQTTVRQSGCPGDTAGGAHLDRLVELVIQRLALAQDVAAVKIRQRRPIDDPVRELEILESAARALNAPRSGRRLGIQFVRDQIEASKVIQRGLHHRWYRHPEEVPAADPDLGAEVRPELDRITAQIIRQINCLNQVPCFADGDITDLVDKRFSATEPGRQLPGLHRDAAVFALRSLCAGF